MAIALVANVGMQDGATGTTANIDTTGATLLVALVYKLRTRTSPLLTDSKGNTWTPLTAQDAGSISHAQLYYAANPSVGSGHNFTLTNQGGDNYLGGVCVAAFSDVDTSSPFNKEDGNIKATSGTTILVDSVTPDQNNSLVVTGLCNDELTDDTFSINGGFTITDAFDGIASPQRVGGALAYLVQTSAAAAGPTWTWVTSSVDAAGVIAVFKPTAGSDVSTALGGSAFTGGHGTTVPSHTIAL